MRRTSVWCIGIWCIGLLCGCGNKTQYIPTDIAPVDVEIVRFDSALLSIAPQNTLEGIERLYAEYDVLMPVYVEGILRLDSRDTVGLSKTYADFLQDTVLGFSQTNEEVRKQFADISQIQKEMNEGFARLHWLYPEWEIPSVFFFVSGFNGSIFQYEDMIGVGVDMYLGSDYPYYNQVVYDYQKHSMRKESLVGDVLNYYIAQHIPYTSRHNRLLERMIFCGKQMFLLAEILPELAPWDIINYKEEQWVWCEMYEQAIWNRVMDNRDLFKTESMLINSYVNDGPFTAEVSQESPGRLGIWIGWRIVASYMRHNEHVSLQELMADGDAQKILEQSFYKP